jgi:hypothetical protein
MGNTIMVSGVPAVKGFRCRERLDMRANFFCCYPET